MINSLNIQKLLGLILAECKRNTANMSPSLIESLYYSLYYPFLTLASVMGVTSLPTNISPNIFKVEGKIQTRHSTFANPNNRTFAFTLCLFLAPTLMFKSWKLLKHLVNTHKMYCLGLHVPNYAKVENFLVWAFLQIIFVKTFKA